MNPFDLSASDLLVWGIVLHLIADWPLQNDWMARNKATFGWYRGITLSGRESVLPLPHPAAFVHAGIHGALLAFVFGWAAAPLAFVHLLIDLRKPVAWWSRLVRQTQPVLTFSTRGAVATDPDVLPDLPPRVMLVDVGTEVRFWTDQVFHIACIAIAALLVTA